MLACNSISNVSVSSILASAGRRMRQGAASLLMLSVIFLSAGLAQAQLCSVSVSLTPSAPVAGQSVTFTANVLNVPAVDNDSATVNLDGAFLCSTPGQQGLSCSATVASLTAGTHTLTWSCTESGTGGNGSNSGSQSFTVAPSPTPTPSPTPSPTPTPPPTGPGTVNPKFIVLSVIYAPPGQASNVDYGSSTLVGGSTTFDHSFADQKSLSMQLQFGPDIKGPNLTAAGTHSFTQTQDSNQTITLNKTTTFDMQVPGPTNSSDGINHDFDVIVLWINPVLNLNVTSTTSTASAVWTGYSFDVADPANEVDIVPVYVGWLKNPSTMPPGVAAVLARTWAAPSADGSGPGLDANDFATILARDPFANGSTTIDPTRFDLTGQTFSYAPPANGGQPLTQKFALQYQTTSTQGKTAIDEYKITHSVQFNAAVAGFFKAQLKDQTTLTWTSSAAQTSTNAAGQTATLTLTDPSSTYNGPTDLQVYQDNVYGTFMFAFVPEQPVQNIWATPPGQILPLGGIATYQVGLSALTDFTGSVSLSASVSPAGCGTVTFSPASITGSATSTMSLSCSTAGAYAITITGTGGTTHTTKVNLTVSPSLFVLAALPASQAVTPGGSTTYTVMVQPATGFNGSVALSAAAPTGCGAITFNPATVSGAALSTMTVPTCSAPGQYTITISGTSSGSPTATTTVGLTVAAPPTQTGSGCTIATTLSPTSPVAGDTLSFSAAIQQPVPALNYTGSVNVDGQLLCNIPNGSTSCQGALASLSTGSHAINWSCSSTGSGAQPGSGSGTQLFSVGLAPGAANLRPKFIVLSVLYAPPGQASSVDYATSTLLGTSSSFKNTFADNTTKTVTTGGGVTIGPFSAGTTVSNSQSFTQTGETNNSLAVNKTQTSDFKIPGPKTSADGIDHTFDVILVWINPIVNFTITGPNTAKITGYSFDPADPANEMDVVPLYVGWLQNPLTIPPGVKQVLARSWAGPPTDGSGPGLTNADFSQILARDPFTDPNYVPTLNFGATTTTDGRFDLVDGETLSYAPPATGDQPLQQKFNLQYQDTSQGGLTATDSYEVGFEQQITLKGSVDVATFFKVNFSRQVTTTSDLTWTNQATQTSTTTNTRTASLVLTGPSTAYNGPTDLQLFQDNVYGTFMFVFSPNTRTADFGLLASPDGVDILAGGVVNSQVSLLPLNGFSGSVSLSGSVSPASGCGAVTFNPATISGTAKSVASVSCTTAGTYTLTITGTSGTISHTATVAITVFPAPTFILFSSPSQVAMIPGGATTSFTVFTAAVGGFNGTISFSVSGLPAGATSSFNPPTVTGTGSTVLTIGGGQTGTYPLTITATSGSLLQTTGATLVVASAPNLNGCTAQITITPSAPSFNTPVTIAVSPLGPPGIALTVSGSMDNNGSFCSATNTGCFATFNNLASGIHAATWSCSGQGVPSGSNTQLFAVGPTGALNPKYLVLSVMYAPPGQSSSVDYGSSKMLGTATSITDTFQHQTVFTSTLNLGLDYSIRQHKKNHEGDSFSISDQRTETQTFTESLQGTSTITVNKTQNSDQIVPGPKSSTTEGIDHDFDVILLWINPVIEFTITGPSNATIAGYSFDENDPVGEMDVVPVYVAWLKDPSLMPPGVQFALGRLWADQPLDGSGTGLTNTDFQAILARDPFAQGAAPIDTNRFVLTGETFAYAPAPNGGQPFTEKSTLSYLTTNQQSVTVTDKYAVSFSTKASDSGSVQGFLAANAPNLAQTGGIGGGSNQTLTITNSNGVQTTQSAGQTATLSLVGPSSAYTGPNDLQVYQDTVYGTFLFAFVPETNFQLFIASPSQVVAPGASAAYSISTGVISNFSGTIVFSTNGLPAGATPSFSPATLSGAGSTTLTMSTLSSLPPGVYGFTIIGTVTNGGATETHAVNATLVVSPAANFTFSMSPSANEVTIGGSTSYTITVSSTGGFTGNVALTASNLPPGATAMFNPASIAGTGSSTVTISPANTTAPGNYLFTVTGTSGLLTQSALADVAVAAAPTQTVSGTPCAVNIAISPSTPLANQTTTFQATITLVPPANNWNLSVTLDGQPLCGPTTSSCSSTQSALALGPHTLGWSCTDSGTAGSGSGSGTQSFTVAPPNLPSGSVNPKFLVLSVIYTPPGSRSTVDYGTSTAVGTTTSINNSFASANTRATVTLTNTIPVPPANPNEQLGSVGGSASVSATSGTFTETLATATSVAINKTTSFDIQVPGLSNPTDGIDHDYDIILVWLNPVLNLQIVDSATAQIPGYSFDPSDPAGEVDVIALYVKWLKNPQTMPPGIANALARVWAAPPADGSGPGLTTADLQAILARDPFTNPSYQLTVNPGATTSTDGRFDVEAGETFAYEPPPFGGQPLTDKFSIQYQQTSTTGQSTTDQYQTSFSLTGQSNIKGWLSGNLQTSTLMTWTNQFALKTTNVSTQTASLSLVGPCFGYNGPTDVQVFQDNVYGTFMFAFVNNPQMPDFSLCVTSNPNPLTVNTGASGNYTVFSSPSNGFTGTVNLTATGLPAGFGASFSPASITGSATSTLTVTVPPSAAAGTYTFTVSGTRGTLTHSTTVLLVVNAAPAFSLSAAPTSQSANLGANANFTISTTAFNGFTGSVALSASVSPSSGCSVPVLSPTSISGAQTSTLTLSCSVGGSYSITITGTSGSGSSKLVQTVPATLGATDFSLSGTPSSQSLACGSTSYTISATALNGFGGSVALSASVSGAPAGVTTSFSPASIAGAGSSNLTVTTTTATPVGTYSITVTGTSGNLVHTTTLTLQVTDFGGSVTPSSQTVTAGNSTTFSLSTTAINGFNGTVALSVSGLPANATATFTPTSITGAGSSTLTISTSSSTPTGTFTLTLTGASGCRSHTATVTLVVNPGSTPGTASVTIGSSTDRSTQVLTHAATPANVTVTIGGSDSTNFTVICGISCHSFSSKDTGTLRFTIMVGGVTVGPVSASYNGSSTPATLASSLFSSFPTNSVATISNPNGGASFTITTIAAGSSTNSSTISTAMVTNCVDSDTLTCGGVGWSMTLSGPGLASTTASNANFTGGTDNVFATVFDTGAVTLSVTGNGTTYTKTSSYGQNSTPEGIALDLSNQINGDAAMKQVVTASASGNVLNMTTVATGPSTGYPLTVSSATTSTNFTSGSTSFPVTPSGSTFTPGH